MASEPPPPPRDKLVWPPFDKAAFDRRLLAVSVLTEPMLPSGWGGWVFETAHVNNTPPDYIALSLIVATAGTIGNTRRVVATAAWSEPIVLWGVNVGPPSSRKSVSQSVLARALKEVDQESLHSWKDECKRRRDEHRLAVAEAKRAKELPPRLELPKLPRLVVGDTTVEALSERLAENPQGLVAAYDELGAWLGSFDRYSGNGFDRSFYLSCYGAERVVRDRVGSEKDNGGKLVIVERAALSILGAITPDKLKPVIESTINDGFVSRLLMAWPEPLPVAPVSREHDEGFSARHAKLTQMVRRLRKLPFEHDQFMNPQPKGVRLSEEAFHRFNDVQMKINTFARAQKGLLAEWLGKASGRLLRLALVYEYLGWVASVPEGAELDDLVEGEPREIGADALERARAYLNYQTEMFRRVIGGVEPTGTDDDAEAVIKLLLREGLTTFSLKDLNRQPGFRWLRGEIRGKDRQDKDRQLNVIKLLIDRGAI